MLPLFALLLTAAPAPAPESAGKTVDLPPARQEIVYRIPVLGNPLRLEAEWRADTEVSVVILEEAQFRLRRKGEPHSPVAFGDFERAGSINGWLPGNGTYLVVVDNRLNSQRAAKVELKVNWRRASQARHPDPDRARTLVIGSSALFLALCVFAGSRLRQGIETRE